MDKQTFYELARLHELWLEGEEGGRKLVLDNAKIEGFEIDGLCLEDAEFTNCYFNVSVVACAFDGAFFANCYFKDCRFDDVDMSGTYFETCNFDGCTLKDVYLAYTYMKHVIFVKTLFTDCEFSNSEVALSYFINADLKNTTWYNANRESTLFIGGFNGVEI